MKNYQKPNEDIWTGRTSDQQLYMHEKIKYFDLSNTDSTKLNKNSFAILGYACDEGVRRNQGRVGAKDGPMAIRKMLASLSNHFSEEDHIIDIGDIICQHNDLEKAHRFTSETIAIVLKQNTFPIILGGGHDLAYAHYQGIKKQFPDKSIGIINLDAHFDLRKVTDQRNSGTPFYQISQENEEFNYLCLGIQRASNNRELYDAADQLGVQYLENDEFTIDNKNQIQTLIEDFSASVDYLYLTIDIDGFSSAYAPGVSAPSPLGFSVDIAIETIRSICKSGKLISVDLVELNPKYDIDNCTARLAARLVYDIMQNLSKKA